MSSPAFFPELGQIDFDLQKAKQILADAAHPNGFSAELLLYANNPFSNIWGPIYQADLAKIGVQLTLRDLSGPAFLQMMAADRWDWDMVTHLGWGTPISPLTLFSANPFKPDPKGSYTRYDSPRYRELASQALAENDSGKRQDILRDITRLHQQDQWVAVVADRPSVYAVRSDVKGVGVLPGNVNASLAAAWLEV